mmetsp:Transcript_17293/g.55457  ORF Transcript_17293/g.55457 Transcript_17293/m.55457 type:complete len:267 (-) Transcript_17293:1776-2576(-)
MVLSSNSKESIATSMGIATIQLVEHLRTLSPDLMIILGDRYECLPVAQVCLVLQIPICHICGGDVTEGAYDDSIRHAITKLSHIHFPTNADSAERIAQMGENCENIHNVGFLGLNEINHCARLNDSDLAEHLHVKFGDGPLILVLCHPETHEVNPYQLFSYILSALQDFLLVVPKSQIFFIYPNADNDSNSIITQMYEFQKKKIGNCEVWKSLARNVYLSLLARVSVLVGNSSSGVYDAPALGTPVVNVGDRQKGRLEGPGTIKAK